MNPGPLFASSGSLCCCKKLGFHFKWEGRRAVPRHEVISSSFALPHMLVLRGARVRSKEEEYFREGRLPKRSAVQLTSSKQQTHFFPRGIAGSPACLEGRFDRTCVMDSVKSFQQAIKKRWWWGRTLLAFFHDSLGNWKSSLWNSEATVNSWRERRCPKHCVSDKNCSEFCSLQTKKK